jgi:hypothetical protein
MYRSAGTLRAALATTVAVPVFAVLGLVQGDVAVGFVLAGLLAIMAWRNWQWGISASADDVRVGQFFVTRTVRWEEIEAFYVAPLMNSPAAGWVRLNDGRELPTFGISTARPLTDRRRTQVQVPVDELNATLAGWRKAHPTHPDL